jgi:hypothetical protein
MSVLVACRQVHRMYLADIISVFYIWHSHLRHPGREILQKSEIDRALAETANLVTRSDSPRAALAPSLASLFEPWAHTNRELPWHAALTVRAWRDFGSVSSLEEIANTLHCVLVLHLLLDFCRTQVCGRERGKGFLERGNAGGKVA